MDPTCHFCNKSTKGRCKTQEEAYICADYVDSSAMLQKKIIADQFENDFGFTFTDDDLEKTTQLEAEVSERNILLDNYKEEAKIMQKEIENLDRKSKALYNAIIPFLDNLCMNPEQPNIRWPNRVEKIAIFKQKLQDILEGN